MSREPVITEDGHSYAGSIGSGIAGAPEEPEGVRAWHAEPPEVVLAALGSARNGLSASDRAGRLAHHGPNQIRGQEPPRWWSAVLEALTEPIQLLLVAVAVLAGVFGEVSDAISIAVVVIVVAGMEALTEQRTARTLAALGSMTAPTARVRSGETGSGATIELPAVDLVPGDVVVVEAGDVVPADARLTEARGLRVDESTLTGESLPVEKHPRPVAASTALGERTSMVHSGSAVLAGTGQAVVVATGAASELGRLGHLVTDTEPPTTGLARSLAQLARLVLIIALVVSVLVPAVGWAAGQPWREMLLAGLTLAFATVPEELPILVTVLLAVGGRRLARRGALLQRLRAGETLGAVTYLVSDKTGTLTENTLEVVDIVGRRREVLQVAVQALAPTPDSREPFETALAEVAGPEAALTGTPIATFGFDTDRRRTSRIWPTRTGARLAVVGAPETLLERCHLEDSDRAPIDAELTRRTSRGGRVLAVAVRDLDLPTTDRHDGGDREREWTQAWGDAEVLEQNLRWVGLLVFSDPLREGVTEAAADLAAAGVSTVVVTGDHPVTAAAIALEAGLPPGPQASAGEVDTLTDAELDDLLRPGAVIARATPATKHRVVRVLQARGEVVAVTGDGANDAPALAVADVGIALGRRGSQLARDAADVIFTDDAYPTVVTAVAGGRNISTQLRRAVAFYLAAKLALVVVLLVALSLGLPAPFAPVHIVVVELFMDLGASLAFVGEPPTMKRPPPRDGDTLLNRPSLVALGVVTCTLSAAVLGAYVAAVYTGAVEDEARAAAVAAWLAAHALIAWTLRATPTLSPSANPAFPAWAAAAVIVAVLAASVPAPGLHVAPLGPTQLALTGLAVVLAVGVAVAARARRDTARPHAEPPVASAP